MSGNEDTEPHGSFNLNDFIRKTFVKVFAIRYFHSSAL